MVCHCPGVAAAPCFPGGLARPVHLPRDPAACIFLVAFPLAFTRNMPWSVICLWRRAEVLQGVSAAVALFRSFLREAFKKSTDTLISEADLSGLSWTSLDSWD